VTVDANEKGQIIIFRNTGQHTIGQIEIWPIIYELKGGEIATRISPSKGESIANKIEPRQEFAINPSDLRNRMRGDKEMQGGMYSYISAEQRVPADHPLRPIRKMTDEIFKQLSPRFDKLYSRVGRPSIAPERLLRALLLQVLYSVRTRSGSRTRSSSYAFEIDTQQVVFTGFHQRREGAQIVAEALLEYLLVDSQS
jgi:hypothetical protein